MARRDSVPNAAALERIEPPSPEVAEAQRRAVAAQAADKLAVREAIATIDKLNEESKDALPAVIDISEAAELEERERVNAQAQANRGPRGTMKRPAVARSEQQTSPSLARVLGGPDDHLVEDRAESLDEPAEPAAEPIASNGPARILIVIGAALAVALLLGMITTAIWGGGPSGTEPSGATTSPSVAPPAPTAKQTAPVSAIATATAEPTVANAASSGEPERSTGSARSSAKTTAKTAESSSKPTPPITSSAKPQKTNWVPEDS